MSHPNNKHYDLVIVGGGIVGLAHALLAARRGLCVAVFERNPKPRGASARNFGMLWPIGQPPGKIRERALCSMETWQQLFTEAGVWNDPCGSLLLARHADELAVLEEFSTTAREQGYDCDLLSPKEVATACPATSSAALLGGLLSRQETLVEPGQALARITSFLKEAFAVAFYFDTEVHTAGAPLVETSRGSFTAERVLVCSGADFETLFPEVFRESGISRCKLQMMKTSPQPKGWKLGAMVTDSLAFRSYPAFRNCESSSPMQERILREHEDLDRLGVTVFAAQNKNGEIIAGDSHHYARNPPLEDDPGIDEKISEYLGAMLTLPRPEISTRWSAVYPGHPHRSELVEDATDSARVALVCGGNGMTTAFGLAQEVIEDWY